MSGTSALQLALELDRETEPIAGRLRRDDGTTWSFTGWLELTRVLEEAQGDDDRSPERGGGCKR